MENWELKELQKKEQKKERLEKRRKKKKAKADAAKEWPTPREIAQSPNIDCEEKAILQSILSRRADEVPSDDGHFWATVLLVPKVPSGNSIESDTQLGKGTIQDRMRRLEKEGILICKGRQRGDGGVQNRYRIAARWTKLVGGEKRYHRRQVGKRLGSVPKEKAVYGRLQFPRGPKRRPLETTIVDGGNGQLPPPVKNTG